ncbi:hypothetical protein ONZ45_g18209 [Pleurotus djamor]|nr:hypothetical protein ONZ45_g18209 [Pleurotus djamor]
MSAGSSHPQPVRLTPSSPENPLNTVPLPEGLDINQYGSHRPSGYEALHELLPEINDEAFSLLITIVKAKSKKYLVRSLEFQDQTQDDINTLVKEVLKVLPLYARYEDAWPIKALAAKFLVFSKIGLMSHSRARAAKIPKRPAASKENNRERGGIPTKRKRNRIKFLGKKPTQATLTQLQAEYNTRHVREALKARQGALRPKPLITRLKRRRLSTISITSSEDEEPQITAKKPRRAEASTKIPLSNLTNRSQPTNSSSSSSTRQATRKTTQYSYCLKCKHVEPCSPERRKRLTNAFPEEGLGQVLQELGVTNDDDLNLLLRYSEEDRKELLDKEGFSRFRTFQIEKRLQRLTPIDGDVILEGVTDAGEGTRRTTQTSSLSSIASSSKTLLEDLPAPNTTHVQCTQCNYKEPETHIICPTIRNFLTSAGLSKLLPAFVEMEVFNDAHFKELCEWTEADRSDLFRNPGTIHLTRFQQFALKMAFRYRDD